MGQKARSQRNSGLRSAEEQVCHIKRINPRPHEARLFICSNATGVLDVEEVHDFSQDDLLDDDVAILDTFVSIYVWIGNGANEKEKQGAMDVAHKYVAAATDGRDPDCPIAQVKAGSEPRMFTTHFLG